MVVERCVKLTNAAFQTAFGVWDFGRVRLIPSAINRIMAIAEVVGLY